MDGISQRSKFLAWSIGAIFAAAFGLVRGRWAGALMLGEAARARQVALTPPTELAREYLFHLGTSIYRPLWTYAAEAKGSLVTLYNYAASFGGFKTKEPDVRPLEFGLQSMSWPRILMWTEPYARFCRTVVRPELEIKVVPAIWFSDADEELPVLARPAVGVFDVTPVRSSGKAFNVNPFEYRTFDIGRKFLEDVYAVVHGLECDLMWKRKRGYGSIHDKRYIAFANEFALRPGVVDVSPGISAFRVVENCNAVISMPFTSTAFIASQAGIPSVFYDPTGLLFADDCGAQGVPVLSSRSELSRWLEQAIDSSNILLNTRGVTL